MMPDVTRLDTLRARRPLIHCISNLVTANDCANLLLAAGASPIMAQALPEAEEITAASAASVLNTGTPDDEKFRLCLACGRAASALGHPTVLDPVGIGASRWRLQSIQGMLHLFTPSILRVNLGEARALLQLQDAHLQAIAAQKITALDLSVRQAERLCKQMSHEAAPKAEPEAAAPLEVDYIAECEAALSRQLGRGVKIINGKRKGRFELEFYGQEDLQRLLELLSAIPAEGGTSE